MAPGPDPRPERKNHMHNVRNDFPFGLPNLWFGNWDAFIVKIAA
jgi:hypothetical protein